MFFFKQKTAYEMRIIDWSSDVCSSDLAPVVGEGDRRAAPVGRDVAAQRRDLVPVAARDGSDGAVGDAGRHDLDVGRFEPPGHLVGAQRGREIDRSEEHTSELQSLMRISYAVFCLKKKKTEQH